MLHIGLNGETGGRGQHPGDRQVGPDRRGRPSKRAAQRTDSEEKQRRRGGLRKCNVSGGCPFAKPSKSEMCKPYQIARAKVSQSPMFNPAGPAAVNRHKPTRLMATAAQNIGRIFTPNSSRLMIGAVTTNNPVMNPLLVAVVWRKPSVWQR